MIEDHGHSEPRARTIRWNQNLPPHQCGCKVVNFEGHMRNRLDRLGVRRTGIKSHPLDAERTGLKSRYVNVQAGHVNLVRTRDLRGNSNVVKSPAMPGYRSWRFVVLSQILIQTGISLGPKAVRLYVSLAVLHTWPLGYLSAGSLYYGIWRETLR